MTVESRTLSPNRSVDFATPLALICTILGWASAFAGIRVGLTAFGPFELGSLRFAIAAVPAILMLAVLRPAWPTGREFLRIALRAFICVALYTVLLNVGEKTISGGAASFIVNTAPILTALLAVMLLGEKFGWVGWIGTALSFAGVTLVAASQGDGFNIGVGALFIIGAAFCTAIDAIIQKPLFLKHKPLVVSAWSMIFAALFLSPGLPHALAQFAAAAPTPRSAVIYLGIVPSFIAYGTWSITVSRFPASRAANFLYCIPPTATLMGAFWLGEIPNWLGIFGGFMTLAGVAVVNIWRKRG
ncbi:MAG TPA: DMT family transporter [Dongiaceae bacterium]